MRGVGGDGARFARGGVPGAGLVVRGRLLARPAVAVRGGAGVREVPVVRAARPFGLPVPVPVPVAVGVAVALVVVVPAAATAAPAAAAALRVVADGQEDQPGEQQREQLVAVAHRGEEDTGADHGQQHRADRLAVHPAGEHPLQLGAAGAALAVRALLGRHDQPGQAVQEEAEAAGEAEHDRHHAEHHRVDVQVPAEAAADAGHHAVVLGPGQRGSVGRGRGARPGLVELLCAVVFGHAHHPGGCRTPPQPVPPLLGP
ncbi:hypothetical protein GCM10009639_69100 [Kitasatospora putterlickiae]|uniref:Uncharacterized protein n=1 Tax=Kitasatospora putterlickiae TaxID=221725 RepID=A0ABN1YIW1_9ACTN